MKLSITLLFLVLTTTIGAQIPCNGEFIPTGDATNSGGCIQMTPNINNQQGCAWLNTPVDFSMPFTHTMTASFGFSDAGADGICLVYQSNGPGICGLDGGGIGAIGIPNSFIVEFDTWDNGAMYSDIVNDHCAVDINGDFTSPINGPADLGNIEDGANHTISFTWDPTSMSYSISFDGGLVLSGNFDIINNCFGGNPIAYWGYSSSTGAATNPHIICPVLPPPIVLEAGIDAEVPCASGVMTLNGSVSPSNPNFVFQWSSIDGTIVSGANTLTPQVTGPGTYTLTLTDPNGGCMESDQVVISIDPIIASITPPPFFPCDGTPIFLDGSGSSIGPFISYQWTTSNGLILSGANTTMPMIGAPGFYNLTVTYNNGAGLICVENQTVEVFADTNIPFATAMDATITCDPGFVVLSGLGSTTGGSINYQWTTNDGLIISDANTLFPTVGAAGVYTLLVTNLANGCFDEIDVVVSGNLDEPVASAVANDNLDCQTPTVTLDGSGSSQGNNITYEWITADGNILSGGTSVMAVVDEPGNYTLIVTNTDNGCTQFADVMVTSDGEAANIAIEPPAVLTCTVNSMTLDATNSDQAPELSYTWTTSDGEIQTDTNTLTPTVSAPGTYYLTIENSGNGCVTVDSVEVNIDEEAPTVEAGNPQILSCDEDFIELTGNAQANNPVDLVWSTADGSIISDETNNTIQVDAAGTYYLEATNTSNGCSAIDSVLIGLDNDVPNISLIADDTLNCSVSEILIDASGSDQGSDFTFSWTTTDGNFVSGENTLQPLIDAPGTYNLEIINTTNDCTNEMELLIVQDTLTPSVNIGTADTLNCTLNQIVIDAMGSSQGPAFTYNWSSLDGNIVSGSNGLSPMVNEPGTYTLNILNTQNDCSSEAMILVAQDTISPTISISDPPMLTCAQTDLSIDAGSSSMGPNFSHSWSTTNGNITGGNDGLTPNVDAPGTYQLEIENTANGCIATGTVSVEQDTLPPLVDAGVDLILNCNSLNVELDGSGSSSGPDFEIMWFDSNDDLVDDMLTPTINDADTYVLEVLNVVNGCSNTDTVLVEENFDTPESIIAPPANLTCTDSLVQLDGSASTTGTEIAYTWTTPNGNIFSGASLPIAEASQAGQYFLTVENTESGCIDTDSTMVMQDANFPVANIDPAVALTCDVETITLQGTAIGNSANLDFQWNTNGGNFVSGANTLAPVIDQPGSYSIQVTDLDNNCQAMASIEIQQDITLPAVDPGASQELNCYAPTLLLDGSGSDQGAMFSYSWQTVDGSILSGSSGLSPEINTAGTYTLVISNLDNGCIDSAQVVVTEDFVEPDLSIATPDTFYCNVASVQLSSATSLAPAVRQFNWTTAEGNIQTGDQSASPTVIAPGTYQATLQNLENGCQVTDSIEVFENTEAPLVQLAAPEILNCAVTSQQLSAQGSDFGMPFQVEWTTNDGNIINGSNSLAPEIDQPGTYQLSITNTINACATTEEVTVQQDTVVPSLSIIPPAMLTCNTAQLNLNAVGSSGGVDFNISWTTTDGNIVSGQAGFTPVINEPGTYQLTIQNTGNQCEDSLSVTVVQDISTPAIDIQPPLPLNCTTEEITIDASNSSSGPLFAYSWETDDGQITTGGDAPTPQVNAPGAYTLTIVNLQNGCDSSQSVQVSQDTIAPTILFAPPAELNCGLSQTNLDASASSNGNNFVYNWSTYNGNLVGANDIPDPLVDQPGAYTLAIINTENGCVTMDSVTVSQDVSLPTIAIETPSVLNCIVTSVTLDASGSSAGGNFDVQWTNVDSNIIVNPNSLTPSIQAPGLYTLSILNTANECQDSMQIEVQQDITVPEIVIAEPGLLTCAVTEQVLDASNSSTGNDFTYSWNTADGQIQSGMETPTPVIDQPGTYTLTLLNTQNGCDSVQSVVIDQNITTPQISIAAPTELNCNLNETTLDASNSSSGPTFTYQWTTPDGNILTGANTTLPMVSEPGTYNLLIQNTFNGCDTTASTVVTENIDGPILDIEPPVTLNCLIENTVLDASSSSTGSNFEFDWTTTDGNIAADANTLTPTIDASGTYQLLIVNTDNDCVDSLAVTVPQDITPPIAAAGEDFVLPCFETSAPLDGSGSSQGNVFLYQWTSTNGNLIGGQETLFPEIEAPGIYTLQVTNIDNGCENSDQVEVIQTIPEAEVSITPPLCYDDPASIAIDQVEMGIAPYVYSIDGGDNFFSEAIFNNLDAGNFEVVVQDVNGCQYEESLTIQQPDSLVVVVIEPEQEIRLGESIQLFTQTSIPEEDIASIFWQHDGSLSCDTCLHPVARPFRSTQYSVQVQSINGCVDQAQVSVTVDRRADVYIPNAFSPGDSDGFNDRFFPFARPESVREVQSFQIFSRWGEVLFEAFGFQPNDPVNGWDGTYRGQLLNAGVYVYFAEVEMTDGSVVLFKGDVTLVR